MSEWGAWGGLPIGSLRSAAIKKDTRSYEWRLAPIPILGEPMLFQNMGEGTACLCLCGSVYPNTGTGDMAGVEDLLQQAKLRIPLPIVLFPQGRVLGNFFLQHLEQVREQLIGSQAYWIDVNLTFIRQGGA